MTKDQLARLAKYEALGFLGNAAETNGIAAFAAKFALYEARLAELRAIGARQDTRVSASLVEREVKLDSAILAALTVGGIALSYADQQGDKVLADKVRVRPNDFRRLRLSRRVHLAQQIHDVVAPVVPQLADHGVTREVLLDLQTKIDAAGVGVGAPRAATVSRKAATAQLVDAFKAMNGMIENHFDPLLLPLKQTHPEFYRRYLAARQVVNRPGTQHRDPDAAMREKPAATPAPIAQPLAA